MNLLKKDIIFSDVNKLKGVGKQLSKYLKNKKIEKVKDILLNLPYSETDRSRIINLNKLDGELIESEIYTMYKTAKKEDRSYFKRYGCDSSDKDLTSRPSYIRKPEPCSVISTKEDTFGDGSFIYVNIEEVLSSGWIKTNFIPIERIYERREDSTSYGHKILKFGSIDSFVEPVLDRVDLGAAIDSFELGDNGSPYQCEVTSKEIYEAKIQEQQNLVDDLVETTKKEKAEREAQKTQI